MTTVAVTNVRKAASPTDTARPHSSRFLSVDVYRGVAVAGMLLVDYQFLRVRQPSERLDAVCRCDCVVLLGPHVAAV